MSPNDRSFTFLGGTGSITLTTGATCTWSATKSEPWVTIVSGGSGTGSGEVHYLVLPNALLSSREAFITIGNISHRVRQAAALDDKDDDVRLEGNVSGLSGSCPSMQFTVQGRTVSTSNETDFKGGNCGHLVNGVRVDVKGDQQTNGTVVAREVRLHR